VRRLALVWVQWGEGGLSRAKSPVVVPADVWPASGSELIGPRMSSAAGIGAGVPGQVGPPAHYAAHPC
jgi:hypothetical protein